MTRQEAIKILKAKLACMEREVRGTDEDCNKQNCLNCDLNYKQGTTGEQMEVLRIAIDALGADNNVGSKSDDLISRAAAIDAVSRGCEEFRGIFAECEKNLNELPPAQPEPCGDCVSRKAVIRLLHSGYHSRSMIEEVRELPSVQPKPLTEAEVVICKLYLDDLDKYKTCNEYKLLMGLLDGTASAQPEIIMCRDCKYYAENIRQCRVQICASMDANDYCSKAERKDNV